MSFLTILVLSILPTLKTCICTQEKKKKKPVNIQTNHRKPSLYELPLFT